VVILHGLLGNAGNWQRQARALAAEHRVFTLDLRNHGRSPHAPSMDLSALAADVREFMDAQGLESAALVGHSLGGKVAMTLALETPARVSRLAVVDIAPTTYTSNSLAAIVTALQGLDTEAIADLKDADARLAEQLPDAAVRAFLLTNLKAVPSGYAWRVNLDGIAAAVPEIRGWPAALAAAAYAGPTLFVAGARSDYIRATHYARIRQQFPAAMLVQVLGAGHWVHAEKSESFLAALQPFLAGNDVPVHEGLAHVPLTEEDV